MPRVLSTVALATTLSLAVLSGASSVRAQRHHTVRPGDSLSRIARRYHTTAWNVAAANRMRPGSMLRPGQVLTIPPRGVIYIRPGQTLWEIAREHHVPVDALRRANRLGPRSPLRAGQRLVLPGYRAAARTARNRDWGEPDEPGTVTLRTRDQRVRLKLRDREGRVPRVSLEALGDLMRRSDVELENTDDPNATEPELASADDAPMAQAAGGAAPEEDSGPSEEALAADETEPGDDGRGASDPLPAADPDALPNPRLALLLAALSDHFGGREIYLVSGFRKVGGYTQETSRHVHGRATDIRVRGVPKRALWDYCRSLRDTGCGFYPRSVFVHVDARDKGAQWVDWSRPGQRPWYGTLRRPYPRRLPRHKWPRIGRRVTRPDEVPLEVEVTEGHDAEVVVSASPGGA